MKAAMRKSEQIRLTVILKLSPFVVGGIIAKVASLSWTAIALLALSLVVLVSVAPSLWLTRALRTLSGHRDDEAARRVR